MNNPRAPALIAWFAANPVAANLLMVIILLGGMLSLVRIDKQAFPSFSPSWVGLTALYPGAGPSEIEESVCIPIEEAVHDLSGIKQIKTTAMDGQCTIQVEILQDYPMQSLVNGLRARTQSLRNLPQAVERVDIDDIGWEAAAITVILRGNTDKLTLRHLAEQIRDELGALEGVRRATLWSKIAYEIAVEVPAARLRQHRLTLADIAEAVRKSSLDLPGGELKTDSGGFQLRSKYTAYDRARLLGLILHTHPDGSVLRLGDIATVTDGFAEEHFDNTSDGIPSESISVVPQHDLVEVANDVKRYVTTLAPHLPEGIEVLTRRDNAQDFNVLLERLLTVGATGFGLILGILMLFLDTRTAFWTAAGVVIASFGAFWLLPWTGVTLNMLSLFGFVLAMSILVDDAIIVGERIHAVQTEGTPGLAGAIQGVGEVAVPVTLGVMIALIAFLPGYFVIPSWATQFMKPVAAVMILTLSFSLLESLLILPAHLAPGAAPTHSPHARGWLARLRAAITARLNAFISNIYQPLLKRLIDWRYTTLAGFAAILMVGWAVIEGGYISVKLEENTSYSEFHVHLEPPLGTTYSEIERRIRQFVDALEKVEEDLNPEPSPQLPKVIEGVEVVADEINPTIYVEFTTEARKYFHIQDIIKSWFQHVGDLGDFKPSFHTPAEKDLIDLGIELRAQDPAALAAAANDVKLHIMRYPGIANLVDSRKPGKPELGFKLKPEGERLGLRLKDLAEQVRHAYQGEEAQRFMRGRSEVKIQVRHPRAERQSVENLLAMPIRLPNGEQAPLGAVAEIAFGPGFGALRRTNRMGVATLSIQLVDSPPVSVETIREGLEKELFPTLRQRYAGIDLSFGEAAEEANKIMAGLKRNTFIALAIIYALLAVAFRSYFQPFLFLLAVPVAWFGAVLIHWIVGLNFSFQSLVGMVAASGIVVNDSVVLLHFIQRKRAEFNSLTDLICAACASRFRPILLVALTSIAGFTPMLFETSEQVRQLMHVTLSLAAGLSFGMVATLVLVPVYYAILADVQTLFSRKAGASAEHISSTNTAKPTVLER